MTTLRSLASTALVAALSSLALSPAVHADASTNPQTAPKGKYRIDKNHASVLFCIRHMEISDYCGRFSLTGGDLSFNGSQPEKSTGTFTMDTASVDTPSDKLDEELRKNFFEAAKFPQTVFAVNSIRITGKNEGDIAGSLTLHGVTKPVTLKTTFNGGRNHPMANAYALGFSAVTTIKVSDYQFPDVAWKGFVGEEVKIHIEAEFLEVK